MKEKIANIINESIQIKKELLSKTQIDKILEVVNIITNSIKNGGKLILFGNGGSAADSQHIAGELVGRFQKERRGIAALALTTNTSNLTAIANDYGFELTFARQIEAIGKKGDVVIGISTSGKAHNVIAAVIKAKEMEIKTVALTGGDGGELAELTDISIIIPSKRTPRIQEAHITIGHIICELVEEELFGNDK